MKWILASVLAFACLCGTAGAASLNEIRAALPQIASEADRAKSDGDALVALRTRIEAYQIDLKAEVRAADTRRAEAQRLLARLGPKPGPNQPVEAYALQAERGALETAASQAEDQYKQAQLALATAEKLWNRVTDLRRELFAHRVFAPSMSPLSLGFWRELLFNGFAKTGEKLGALAEEWAQHLDRPNAFLAVTALFLILLALVGGVVMVPAFAQQLLARFEPAHGEAPSRLVIARHALVNLLAVAVPIPVALELFKIANHTLDTSPDSVDDFALKLVFCVAGVTLAAGVLRVLLAPRDRAYRIIRSSDHTAGVVCRTGIRATMVYAGGIALAEFTGLIHTMVVVTVADTILIVLICSVVMIMGMRQLKQAPPGDELTASGLVSVPLGWTQPLIWFLILSYVILVLSGYAALAGFILGRFIVTGVALALAVLLIILIDTFFTEGLSRKNPGLQHLAVAIGIPASTIEIVGTIISGTLRLAIIAVGIFIVFGPWHLEYGEANPFEDAFFGVTLGDLQHGLGTVGFALLAFVVGITGTRLVVNWLDTQLLPRMAVDQGARNSTTTIVGYGGFAVATALALSLLGVNPQNLAVVAGALSVGIGFGLQSIVSNFVSGLIVLAERPIRVGDQIVVKGEEGKVKKISVRSTLISTADKSDIIVPNTDLITSIVRNRTFETRERQVKLNLTLDHDANPLKAYDIMLSCLYHHQHIIKEPMPVVLFIKATELGLEFELRGVVAAIENADRTRSDLHFQIVQTLRQSAIKLARAA